MKITEYSEKLEKLLELPGGSVILINGQWGIGKTHFWNTFIDNYKKVTPHAYVSLFGKKDIHEIKNEALIQIFAKNKHINKINRFFKNISSALKFGNSEALDINFGVSGQALGAILSLFKEKDFHNCVVCFDDFERKSKYLDIAEIIGFGSVLSERYGCKVIMLLNEEEVLKSEDKELYTKYKEKFADYTIQFFPEQTDTIRKIVSSAPKLYQPGILDGIELLRETNLRNITKSVRQITLFNSIYTMTMDNATCCLIGFKLLILCCIYNFFGRDGFFSISDSRIEKKIEEKKLPVLILKYRRAISGRVSFYNTLDKILWDYLINPEFDPNTLAKELTKQQNIDARQNISNKTHDLLENYIGHLSVSSEEFTRELTGMLEENKGQLIAILTYVHFVELIDALNCINNTTEFNSIRDAEEKKYIEDRVHEITEINNISNIRENTIITAIIKDTPELESFFMAELSKTTTKFETANSAIKIMDLRQTKVGWNQYESDFLDSLQTDTIQAYINNDPDFLDALIGFIMWHNSISSITSFNTFISNAKKAIKSIGKSGFGAFRYKKICQYTKISA